MLTISNRTGKKAREMNETKKVSAVDFFCIGFGAIVGVGWAVSINSWMAGRGAGLHTCPGYDDTGSALLLRALCNAARNGRRNGVCLPRLWR